MINRSYFVFAFVSVLNAKSDTTKTTTHITKRKKKEEEEYKREKNSINSKMFSLFGSASPFDSDVGMHLKIFFITGKIEILFFHLIAIDFNWNDRRHLFAVRVIICHYFGVYVPNMH